MGSDWRGNGVRLEGERDRTRGGMGSDWRGQDRTGWNEVKLGGTGSNWVERGRTGGWTGVGQQSLYEIRHFDLCIRATSIFEQHLKSLCKHSISNLEVSLLLSK